MLRRLRGWLLCWHWRHDVMLDEEVIIATNHHQMLHMIPAHQNQTAAVIHLHGFAHFQTGSFADLADSCTHHVDLLEKPGEQYDQKNDAAQ